MERSDAADVRLDLAHRLRPQPAQALQAVLRSALLQVFQSRNFSVIHGHDEFFAVTKAVHNALQGADVEWTHRMEGVYLEQVLANALALEGDWDVIVVHDPQPAALREFARTRGLASPSTKWIWRCHIDLTDARPDVWDFLLPHVEQYDASVWTMPGFVPESMPREGVRIAPPCIDPLSVKNLDLPDPFVTEICKQYGIDTNRPMMVQVSRFDPWKDPLGVLEAYRIVREEIPLRDAILEMTSKRLGATCVIGADGRVRSGMGADSADYDQDGWMDLFLTDVDEELFSLYHNNRDETFDDQSVSNGIGMKAMSVSHGSIESIRAIATRKSTIVLAEYITAGPIIIRTAPRSLVARDIRSPVRCAWK